MLVIDFETEGITSNPIWNPPRPVGVSIKIGDEPSRYLAWGHPTNNNCTHTEAKRILLRTLLDSKGEFIAHNAPFECSILEKYYDWNIRDPLKVHDTMFLLFLTDPYANSFALKPSAERILGLPPDEQTDLKNWILSHVRGASESDWGAYICKAPGDLVGRYAGNSLETGVPGDTDRTFLLYQHLYPKILEHGMVEPYRREQKLMPILSESSKRGVRIDTERLSRDYEIYTKIKTKAEEYIFKVLGEFEISKDAQLAERLDKAGLVTEWVMTPTGKRSVARKNLMGRVKDPLLLDYLSYHGILTTCLGTFAGPWLIQAENECGRVHPQWNQVRGDRGSDGSVDGTRTGRMSCKIPNLQNIPTDFEDLKIPEGLPPMIHMRSYLLPEDGHIWLKRDFSAQEMRILAHYMEGRLYEAFRSDPKTDPHQAVKEMIDGFMGGNMPRKHVKITGFGILYGRGIPNLSTALGVPESEGKLIRDAYYSALPEIRDLSQDIRNRGRRGQFIRTWGGRIYYREPNLERDLSYKLLNYLIQGSAACQTKQVIIDWDSSRSPDSFLLAAVHDELNISVPIREKKAAMKILREQMDADRFDVPMRSEGFAGPNWSDIKEYEP